MKINYFNKFFVRIIFKLLKIISCLLDKCVTLKVSYECHSIGNSPNIEFPISVLGISSVSIGDNFNVRKDFKLRAYQDFASKKSTPEINIGNNFYSGTQSCISAIGSIYIGDNVTLASRVTIIDHSHGRQDFSDIEVPVMQRELSSKGNIYIKDNVWIGEGAIVLGGVTIGKNSIIAANAVVTKDVPPNSIVAGVPARVIKTIIKNK